MFTQSDRAFFAGLEQRARTLDSRDDPCERLQLLTRNLRGILRSIAASDDRLSGHRLDRIGGLLDAIEVVSSDGIDVLDRVELQALALRVSKEVRALPQMTLASLRAVDTVLGLRAAAALV